MQSVQGSQMCQHTSTVDQLNSELTPATAASPVCQAPTGQEEEESRARGPAGLVVVCRPPGVSDGNPYGCDGAGRLSTGRVLRQNQQRDPHPLLGGGGRQAGGPAGARLTRLLSYSRWFDWWQDTATQTAIANQDSVSRPPCA